MKRINLMGLLSATVAAVAALTGCAAETADQDSAEVTGAASVTALGAHAFPETYSALYAEDGSERDGRKVQLAVYPTYKQDPRRGAPSGLLVHGFISSRATATGRSHVVGHLENQPPPGTPEYDAADLVYLDLGQGEAGYFILTGKNAQGGECLPKNASMRIPFDRRCSSIDIVGPFAPYAQGTKRCAEKEVTLLRVDQTASAERVCLPASPKGRVAAPAVRRTLSLVSANDARCPMGNGSPDWTPGNTLDLGRDLLSKPEVALLLDDDLRGVSDGAPGVMPGPVPCKSIQNRSFGWVHHYNKTSARNECGEVVFSKAGWVKFAPGQATVDNTVCGFVNDKDIGGGGG
jgi:hypothetical protein